MKVFGPKGQKFLVTKKSVLATKSKNLGASWPQGFFSKVEPCSRYNFLVCQEHLEAGTCHLFQTFAEKKKQGVNLKKHMTDSAKCRKHLPKHLIALKVSQFFKVFPCKIAFIVRKNGEKEKRVEIIFV